MKGFQIIKVLSLGQGIRGVARSFYVVLPEFLKCGAM